MPLRALSRAAKVPSEAPKSTIFRSWGLQKGLENAIFAQIMAIRTRHLINSIALELANGEYLEMRRVPYLYDTFVDLEGHVVRLSMPRIEIHPTGRSILRCGTNSLMLSRIIMDTFNPGWDEEKNVTVMHRDGNPTNCALSNLEVRRSNRPGRPPTNIHRRLFEALQTLDATLDPEESAKAHNVTREQLMKSCQEALPDLYEKLTQFKPSAKTKHRDKTTADSCLGLTEEGLAAMRRKNLRRFRDRVASEDAEDVDEPIG